MAARFELKGAVAVLTGAASGIGAALAPQLAARGCDLALCDINEVGLQRTAEAAAVHGVKVTAHRLDVADAAAVAALPGEVLAAHGRVSVLINNAGVALFGRFEEMSAADFEWLMGINFWGVVRMTRAFLPLLRQAPSAHIVNLSSIFGVVAPPGQAAYCAAKFGVRGFSESLRHELAGSSVSLTVVHPGGVATNIARNARVAQGADQAELEAGRARSERLLSLSPAVAAGDIVRAIETRAPRLLIGKDARLLDKVQRLFPASYWKLLAGAVK